MKISLNWRRLLSNPAGNNEYFKKIVNGLKKIVQVEDPSLVFPHRNHASSEGHEANVQYQKLFRFDTGFGCSK